MTLTRRPRKIYSVVMYLARFGGAFTPRNLEPFVPVSSARDACLALTRCGQLKRLRKGTPGRNGLESIYVISHPQPHP